MPGVRTESYMIKDGLWKRSGMKPHGGWLCIGCLEIRIGRKLRAKDFTDCMMNDITVAFVDRYAWSWRSDRLLNRLARKKNN